MTSRNLALCLAAGLTALPAVGHPLIARDAGQRFTVPPGFAVEDVWDPAASGSIVAIAFDSRGRLVASREEGPVVRVADTTGDGVVDEHVITAEVTNCQGLEFDGDDLLAVGLGPQGPGLYRVADPDGDGVGNSVRLITGAPDRMQEHGPHAVFWGPDGYLYWIMGNFTHLAATPSPASPYRHHGDGHPVDYITDPRGHASQVRAPGGQILRIDLAAPGADWERVSGGYRNAYDAAFNAEGELFTFDSDMEWDINLPWYRQVRTYHVPPGGEFGWRNGSAMWQPSYLDALPPLHEVGRGSPTGVTFYNGTAFPDGYRDAFYEADWSRGRILVGRLSRDGATYREASSDFLLGTPLNVTDVETGPDGALYFSKGGRKTEGGIWKVVYRQGQEAGPRSGGAGQVGAGSNGWLEWTGSVADLLDHPHPRSAWGRRAIVATRTRVGESAWAAALRQVAASSGESPMRRLRAIEWQMVFGPRPELSWLEARSREADAHVRSAAVYALGQLGAPARRALMARLADEDPFVQRRALEGLIRTGLSPRDHAPVDPVADLLPLLSSPDRFVRFQARAALERTNRNRWSQAALALDTYPALVEAHLALLHTATAPFDVRTVLERQKALIEAGPTGPQLLWLLRPLHLAIEADQGVDYAAIYDPMMNALVARFPSGDAALDRELALSFAARQPDAALPALLAALGDTARSREAQIWLMYAISRYDRGWTAEARQTVSDWFARTQSEQWRGGFSFEGNLAALWQRWVGRQPEADRATLYAAVPGLSPATDTGARGSAEPPWRNRPATMAISEQELREYLELDPMAYLGSAEKGQAVYEKAFCVTCHRMGALGQEAGPDLTDVGKRFKRLDILEAILHPSKTISEQWTAVEFVTTRKQSIVGTIASETPEAFVVRTVSGQQMQLPKKEVASQKVADVSSMPEGLLNGLSMNEIRDLLTFLEKGVH